MENNKTKKIIGFFAMATVLLIVGCKEQPKEEPAVQTVEKEVIVVPAPVVIEKEAPAKTTTVTLDKNGLEVDAKNVEVKIE
jgi:hypothetical protein